MTEWIKKKFKDADAYNFEFMADAENYIAIIIDDTTRPTGMRWACCIHKFPIEVFDGKNIFFTTSASLGKKQLEIKIFDMQFADRVKEREDVKNLPTLKRKRLGQT
ncbi:MAG: hypothetical protein Q8L80_04195 [Gallionella sp.]|nr:hypothetical protein [Gallionella sp.]MDP1941880.1 hypothetical protein [Gallionella sp.]